MRRRWEDYHEYESRLGDGEDLGLSSSRAFFIPSPVALPPKGIPKSEIPIFHQVNDRYGTTGPGFHRQHTEYGSCVPSEQ